MDVIEITRQLGTAIQQDERYIKYAIAKEKNDENEQLQELIGEFNLLRISLNEEFNGDKDMKKDEEKIKELNTKLRECYDTIMLNESMKLFNEAKVELDALINKVNGIIGLCIEGQDPLTCEPHDESCSGSCSSCSGCH